MRRIVVSAAAALIATVGLASAASLMHRPAASAQMMETRGKLHHSRGVVRSYDRSSMALVLTNGSRYEAGANVFRAGANHKGSRVEIQWQEVDGKRIANLVRPR